DNILLCPTGSAIGKAAQALPCQVLELPMAGDLDLSVLFRCWRQLQRLDADLVHVHSRRGADAYGGWAARWTGIPAVISRRVDNLEPKWLAGLRYRPYGAVIAISEAIADLLETRMDVAPERLHRVLSAVDTRRFRPREEDLQVKSELAHELGFSPDRRLIGIIAQFIERKGHADLFAALSQLGQECDDVALLCFGQGPQQAALQQRVKSMGLEGRVYFAGFRDNMQRLLPLLTLVVHPAYAEGLGVALLEAQACGIPVIASAVGGIPEVIADGETGLLVAPGDSRALAGALSKLLTDELACERMGAAARQRVEAWFSIQTMVNGNLAVYHQVLGEAGD
ncbi:MAG: glycosyltransferase, partial [Gammaproteobacteria bacterium]